jgi:hypothetical protein
MQYIRPEADGQLTFAESTGFLMIPCCLYGFHNTETTVHETVSGRRVFCYHGVLDISLEELVCPKCGSRMHVNQHPEIALWHLCIGGNLNRVDSPLTRATPHRSGRAAFPHPAPYVAYPQKNQYRLTLIFAGRSGWYFSNSLKESHV